MRSNWHLERVLRRKIPYQAKLAEAGVQRDKRIGERISGTILEVSIRNDDRTLRRKDVRIGTTGANPLPK
jgi:hypothetical protein